jgi:integrase
MELSTYNPKPHTPWNKGKLVGQKAPLKLQQIWAIRTRLEMAHKIRDVALFNLAIDSKLRSCDLLVLKVRDVAHGRSIMNRAMVMQKKTKQPVQFEITEHTRSAVAALIDEEQSTYDDYLFRSPRKKSAHLSARQYARLLDAWVESIGLDPTEYGTHSLRRTKPTLVYKRTKNLRAVQLLLGHRNLESTVRYLGIEVDDALEMSEQTEI